MKCSRDVVVLLCVLLGMLVCHARVLAVELGSPFHSHMVLQRDAQVAVWGWGEPGEKVTLRFQEHTVSATADAKGNWRTSLPAMPAQKQGQALTVTGDKSDQPLKLDDVLVGDVWLCSGQSNMTWMVAQSRNGNEEAATANDPLIRLGQVTKTSSSTPQSRIKMTWEVCTPKTVRHFSGVAYFFARKLRQDIDVPIGLLHASWPGTPGEAWTPLDAMQSQPVLKPTLDLWEQRVAEYPKQQAQYLKDYAAWEAAPKDKRGNRPRPPYSREFQSYPGNLYNGMILPLAPMTLRGVIWYQGESNRQRGQQYFTLLPTLIASWRSVFENPQLPFGIVQLANAGHRRDTPPPSKEGGITTEIRWVQAVTAASDPHAGLAVAIDTMIDEGIHPFNKQDVGLRLAMWALGDVYKQNVPPSGPLFTHMTREGSRVHLHFKYADGGIVVKEGEQPGRFQIQDDKSQWHWANAKVQDQTVIVWTDGIDNPSAVRYAWEDNPPATLYNHAGLPMVPFTTQTPDVD